LAPSRLRVGVIGCGLIAQVMHLHYLRELADRFEIAAICDLSPLVLNRLGDVYAVSRRFTDWTALLEEPLDAVMVLTSGSHAPAAIAAAQAGLHVFVEKPIALSADEGQAIVAAARKAGVRIMVGYMKRYDPAVERLQDELAQLQPLRFVQTTTAEYPLTWYVDHYPLVRNGDVPVATLQALAAEDESRVTAAIGEADPLLRRVYRRFLLDSMVHDLNLVRGLLGAPTRIHAARVGEWGVSLLLGFRQVECAMHWVNLSDGVARYRQEFAFFGPQRRVTLVFPSPFLRSAPTHLVLEGGTSGTPDAWRTVETVSFEEAFKRELIHFHACVTRGLEPLTPADEAVSDVALCQAVVAAHLSGHPVPL
jgi:predicted dehydrogenase